jgi:hypothetical protein
MIMSRDVRQMMYESIEVHHGGLIVQGCKSFAKCVRVKRKGRIYDWSHPYRSLDAHDEVAVLEKWEGCRLN